MRKKIIYNALAFNEDTQKGRNFTIKGIGLMNSTELYLRNAFVSLVSAQLYSDADTDIALIVNCNLSETWKQRFASHNIQIHVCPFNKFRLRNYNWEFAFYKLCAMDFLLDMKYEHYLQIDSDTIFIRNTQSVFKETASNSILMYEILYDINQPMRKLINDDYKTYSSNTNTISQWGGGIYSFKLSKSFAIE